MKHLNRGEISVFGQKPGTKESGVPGKRVGYMPQVKYVFLREFQLKDAF
jgi:ABC-type multidrug transport system ATPase subunit